jgi:hypothetical protein
VVRTDHYSLKFLLDQLLSTIPQHQWVSKLLGFDFTVEYKPSSTNIITDELSRQDDKDGGGGGHSWPYRRQPSSWTTTRRYSRCERKP